MLTLSRTKQELSLAIAEQADDEAFAEQAPRPCEHIWERQDYRVWQCEACGDLADLSEGWEKSMRKIPTIYKRDPESPRVVTHEYNPACSWIQEGKSRATRKWDGTACMVKDGKLYKRYDCKKGRTPPPDAIPCDDPDPVTGHWPHWVPVGDGPEDRWHNEALEWTLRDGPIADGTYELLHQKFQGRDSAHINPEGVEHPILVLH